MTLHHYHDPLHVYCRLRFVFSMKLALKVARAYEATLWKLIKGVLDMRYKNERIVG